ncbi:flagellar FlbD family protein [Candidatus Caldatribacterium sp. SIUC1]|uniref:flagellar FlbD family protein n=1 Tax=Candidatus Caldatribacterium sp. SIUC1 TaxID=3418365 RepID=UPI003F68C6B7
MIALTRLNGSVFVLNADLIETIEATPDTVISLVTGKKYVVREKVEEVIDRIVAFRRKTGVGKILIGTLEERTEE